jgi:hypothetical protein
LLALALIAAHRPRNALAVTLVSLGMPTGWALVTAATMLVWSRLVLAATET